MLTVGSLSVANRPTQNVTRSSNGVPRILYARVQAKVSFNRGEDLVGQVEGCDDVCGSERSGAISIATAFLGESTIPTEVAKRAEESLIRSLTYTNVSSVYSNNR